MLMARKRERHHRWFSSQPNGFRFVYEHVSNVQFNFIRLLSNGASQKFVYECLNSIAWYSESSRSTEMAIRFLGQDNHEFSYRSINKPQVMFDGCKACVFV